MNPNTAVTKTGWSN